MFLSALHIRYPVTINWLSGKLESSFVSESTKISNFPSNSQYLTSKNLKPAIWSTLTCPILMLVQCFLIKASYSLHVSSSEHDPVELLVLVLEFKLESAKGNWRRASIHDSQVCDVLQDYCKIRYCLGVTPPHLMWDHNEQQSHMVARWFIAIVRSHSLHFLRELSWRTADLQVESHCLWGAGWGWMSPLLTTERATGLKEAVQFE